MNIEQSKHTMRHHIIRIIIGIFVLCGLLTGTAPNAAANQPTPTPTPPPKEWQVRGVLAALKDELPGVQYEAVKKAVELGIAEQIPDEEIPKIISLLRYEQRFPYPLGVEPKHVVAELLGKVEERLFPYIPELIQLSSDENSMVRATTTLILGHTSIHAKMVIPKLISLLSDEDIYVRAAAATSIGNIGEAAQEAVPKLISLLYDANWFIRATAAQSLGNIEESAQVAIPELIRLLSDENDNVRNIAARTLGNIGKTAKIATPYLLQLFSDENYRVRDAATIALNNMGETAQAEAISKLVLMLSDKNAVVRENAAEMLGNIGESAETAMPKLIQPLSDEECRVRLKTIWTLERMGKAAQASLPELIRMISDQDSYIRQSVAEALSNIGKSSQIVVVELCQLLSDEDLDVRRAAVQALGRIGNTAKDCIPNLIQLLSDKNSDVRKMSIEALGKIGEADKKVIQKLVELLSNQDVHIREAILETLSKLNEPSQTVVSALVLSLSDKVELIRLAAARTLSQIGYGDITVMHLMPAILSPIYVEKALIDEQRFLAHFLGASNPNVERLLTWLGKPAIYPTTLTYEEARETLRVFKETWQYTQQFPDVRADLATQIAVVATTLNVPWMPGDVPLLKVLLADLERVNSTHAESLRKKIADIEGRKWGVLALQVLGVHLAVWLLLLLLYPLSSHIQALLWQPLFRNLFGLYIPLLLTSAPFLKRWLLRPFRQVLLADAKLEQFDAACYFPEMEVASPGQSATKPLFYSVPRLRGQVVIEGDSGLGKTMFARVLLRRSRRAAVFLPAEKCAAGIVEAIHAKLPEVVADRKLLRKLVCGGALDLCVDGLNEVSADARATITQFVERSFEGNALLTTQPLEWQPPAMARVFVLQPLLRDRIEAYLLSRYGLFAETPDAIGQADYEAACRAYLAEAFDSRQPPEMLASNQRILSNPMDAVLVTQMLARGQTPSLFRLEEQQYALMAADFARRHIGRAFPLAEFAERVYQMRLRDRAALPFEEFPDEIACMERHKMAVRRLVTERTRPNSAALIAIETRRLPFELRRQIIAFLTALPNMQHQAAQQAFVNSLALDAPLKQGIKIGNASKEFFEMLVETLEGFGTLEDGRDPLEAMLNVAKESVGKEGRTACELLIEELRKIEIAAPPCQNAPTPATPGEQWYFRHEKIMDYFLVQTFFGSENARPRKHLSDSRFRGVYFQLAALLPLDEARQLRETLIQYAADTKDHTVSDTFIQLLRPREILKT